MNLVYIALGSNLGNKKENLDKAINLLNSRVGEVTKKSSYLITKPVDMQSDEDFLNACIELQTVFNPEELLNHLKKIEIELGRKSNSKGKNESRSIDVDIIFFNQIIYNSNELKIPHTRYHLREFVLTPLMEISSNLYDPLLKLTLKQLIN